MPCLRPSILLVSDGHASAVTGLSRVPARGVSIRHAAAPANRQDAPRARPYIVDHPRQGGQIVRHRGPRTALALAAALGAAGFAWLVLDHEHTFSVIGAGLVVGAAVSFGYAAMPAVIMASVPHHQSGIANGINSISRSTGSAIGSAIVTTILASKTIEHLPAGVPALPAESGFTLTFWIGSVAFALVAVISWIGLRGAHGPRTVDAGTPAAAPAKVAQPEPAETV